MKIAMLGGSFNPIHIGHLALADEVCATLGYDRVLFVPVYNPPHKEMSGALPPELRLDLTRLACDDDARFEAESCEIDRKGVSYTYDTVCALEEKYAGRLDGKLGLIMGDDLLQGFHLWNHAADLAARCTLILAQRAYVPDAQKYANRPIGAYADSLYGEHTDFCLSDEPLFAQALRLRNAVLPVSSTDIRRRIAEGRGFAYLVPRAVYRRITEGRLYGYC